jgi:hypothetical protein
MPSPRIDAPLPSAQIESPLASFAVTGKVPDVIHALNL